MSGKRVRGNAVLAGTDRVAIDAAGLALLKLLGSNDAIIGRKIFEQGQIARAVELGPGAFSAAEIDLVPAKGESKEYCDRVREVLMEG